MALVLGRVSRRSSISWTGRAVALEPFVAHGDGDARPNQRLQPTGADLPEFRSGTGRRWRSVDRKIRRAQAEGARS